MKWIYKIILMHLLLLMVLAPVSSYYYGSEDLDIEEPAIEEETDGSDTPYESIEEAEEITAPILLMPVLTEEPAAEDEKITEVDELQENSPEVKEEHSLNETYSEAVSHDSIVVYNFDELKTALSGNNSYVNVFLGADIQMKPLGIEINSGKNQVLISGINPLDGSGPYTINEYNSLDPGYTIRVTSNQGVKEVVLKDVNIIGRNYYGAICVYDTAYGVKVIFENVNYNGPQISYNRGGTVCITGQSTVDIISGNGLSDPHELAEANCLELGGDIVINHFSPVMSGIWLVGSGSYIKILAGAKVTWNEKGTYMIYQDNTTPAEFVLEEDASFTINTSNGLFYDTSVIYHQFSNVIINSNASLKINQQGAALLPILKVKNGVEVLTDGSLAILAQNAPALIFMTGNADFSADYPNTIALYNKTGKLIEWSDSNKHNITVLSTFMNYWSNPCPLEDLGGFHDSPQFRWRKKRGADLLVEVAAISNATVSVNSNYTTNDYGVAPDAISLDIGSARIITGGKLILITDPVTDTSLYISGQTEPLAKLKAIYTGTDGMEHTVYGSADSGGAFDIDISGNLPERGSIVTVYSSTNFKNIYETTVVDETPGNTLAFIHVPQRLVFPDVSITSKRELVARADENWHIIIEDTRNAGSRWQLYVKQKQPLTGTLTDYTIDNALVFAEADGNLTTLGNWAVKAAEGIKQHATKMIVEWPDNRGIMLYADTSAAYSGISYSAEIEWILADVP